MTRAWRTFLEAIHGKSGGSVEIRAIDEAGAQTIACRNLDEAVAAIERSLHRNVYFGVATRDQLPSDVPDGVTFGSKANVCQVAVLWCDIDGLTLEDDDGGTEGIRDEIAIRIEEANQALPVTPLRDPTLIVWSGGGVHLYWQLDEPVDLRNPARLEQVEATVRGIADALGGDMATCDASRVLRVPGTTNYPNAKKRAKGRAESPCFVLQPDNGQRYSLHAFSELDLRGRQLGAQRSSGGDCGYPVEPWSGELPEKVREILDRDPAPKLARRWSGDIEGLEDTSESGIDQSIANLLALELDRDNAGGLIEHALRYRRKATGADPKRGDYYQRTVTKALAWAEDASSRRENQGYLVGTDAGSFFTEKGRFIAEALGKAIQRQGHIRIGIEDGRLYRYRAGVCRPDGEAFAKERTREILGPKWAKRCGDEVVAWLSAHRPTVPDRPPLDTLNLSNGLLRIDTEILRPHTPEFISAIQVPVLWVPDATCPAIEAFVEEVLGAEYLEFFYELIGLLLYPANPFRKAVLLKGSGRNGKSVTLRLFTALLGKDNVSNVALQDLAENRFAAAELQGRLANICGDLDARALKHTDTFKQITGEDRMRAERKFKPGFSFEPFALPVFSCNEVPLSSDQSQGYFDRWIVVPFEKRIPQTQMDPHLIHKLTTPDELQGLLVRGVRGLQRLIRRRDFDLPEPVRQANQDYRERLDSVRGFVEEACTLDPGGWISRATLYPAYQTWCKENGRSPMSAQSAYDRLRNDYPDHIRESKRTGDRGFYGLRLNR